MTISPSNKSSDAAAITDVLTEQSLCLISDHHTREGLRAWLSENKIPYLLAKSGWPRVHRKALETAMGIADNTPLPITPSADFAFDSLR